MRQFITDNRPESPASSSQNSNDWAFDRRLRHLLSVMNITNKEFANLVSIGEGTVSRWVNGKQRPSRRRIALLEQLLGVETGALQSMPADALLDQAKLRGQRPQSPPLGNLVNPLGQADQYDDPDKVMLQFNRWLEPYIENGGILMPVDAVEWMQRMWRASSNHPRDPIQRERRDSAGPDIPLDIDVEPGTGIAITTSTGRLVVVNQALTEMVELNRSDIVGRYVWELNAPEYTQTGQSRVKKQLTEPWDLDLMTGSGERLPVTVSNVSCHLRGNPVRVALVKLRGDKRAG